ncbi:MAG: Slp family lipoprotein [Nitrospirae bacterium]|nr:Slp family lipoprotein [Nitrospirota bacterium]MDE3040420.1 Slp family lipoprotein [Nitrospirota bacterium]MDE3049160.1 Slp family lipoprotein [Nitrospirota bacterium]MDE3220540.1 Slp family lipoprotein [Nitrospirota bacterium]
MKTILNFIIGIAATTVFVGCSTPSLFPPEATRDAAPLEFGVLEAKPDVFKGRAVQLAGRIVGVEQSADGILIRAQELPLERHPAYGPAETARGTSEFAIMYPGTVDANALWFGNKLVVVAVAQGSHSVAVDGLTRTEPYVVARCMHIWKTGEYGSYGIEDFPNLTDGYYPLEHQTYCAS